MVEGWIRAYIPALALLTNAAAITLDAPADPGPRVGLTFGEIYFPKVDPALEAERLKKELAKVAKDLEQTRKKLGDANMLAKAPPAKVEEWRALEATLAAREKSIRETLG